VFLLAAGCSFQPGRLADGVPRDDSSVDGNGDGNDDDAAIDTMRDAAPLPCATQTVWLADFSADPTTVNGNGDGTNDWAMRDMGTLPGTLASGVWTEPGTPTRPLDSQPKQDFATPTRVDVRMRNSTRTGNYGAVFWINVDYTTTTFAPLYVNAQRLTNGAGHEVTLYGKTDAATSVVLVQATLIPFDFVDVSLDIRPATNTVTVAFNGVSVDRTYTEIPRAGNDDRWATVLAWGADADFDLVRVEVCDP